MKFRKREFLEKPACKPCFLFLQIYFDEANNDFGYKVQNSLNVPKEIYDSSIIKMSMSLLDPEGIHFNPSE